MGKVREACGRCSMSSVVDAVEGGGGALRDPFDGDRIEVDDERLRRVSPSAWLGGAKQRLNAVATRIVFGD